MTNHETGEQQQLPHEGAARQLAELEAEIDRLNTTADQAQGEEQQSYHDRLTRLRTQHDDLKDRLHQVRRESKLDWETFSADLRQAWQDLHRVLYHRSESPNVIFACHSFRSRQGGSWGMC